MKRTFPDGSGNERVVLTGWLDWQRATVRRKVDGLNESKGIRALIPTSPRMTIAGVMSHLRWTERSWFAASFPSVAGGDVEVREDGGWLVAGKSLADLVVEYEAECTLSRRVVAAYDLAAMQEFTPPQFAPVSLRWIVTHMINETARHLGHLDVLREQLDGTRGY